MLELPELHAGYANVIIMMQLHANANCTEHISSETVGDRRSKHEGKMSKLNVPFSASVSCSA